MIVFVVMSGPLVSCMLELLALGLYVGFDVAVRGS